MAFRIAVVAGTRPEAIKLIPVYRALSKSEAIEATFIASGQHKQMLADVFAAFSFTADITLDVMTEGQSLSGLQARLLQALGGVFAKHQFDLVIVQGDTSTAFAAALSAHYSKIRVAHVEAGLRTLDKWAPFPEETHRRMIGAIADQHFAATEQAASALAAENVTSGVHIVGNTVIDALLSMKRNIEHAPKSYHDMFEPLTTQTDRYILLTTHRRENFGAGLERICEAVSEIARLHEGVTIIFCVHLNPNVKATVHARLMDQARIHLIEPQPYDRMVYLMMGAWLILTDSGGLQEEAPSLNVPLLVMREKTERPEGVEAGCARLVGTDKAYILSEVDRLMRDPDAHQTMAEVNNPYGDGNTSERIKDRVIEFAQQKPTK